MFFQGRPLGAQIAAPSTLAQPAAESPAVPFNFDVASIKPSDPSLRGFGGSFVAWGYKITNFPLSEIVLRAYFPYSSGSQLIGMPAWAYQERYDIVAHIDEATAPSWLKLNPRQWGQAGRPMLQKLLAERCKLIVHTIPTQVDGYALVVSKRGSRLKPAEHRDTFPDGVKDADPEGGKVLPATRFNNNTMSFFNASIQDLVNMVDGPPSFSVIVDRTNLTGRYDFTIRRLEIPQDTDGKRISDPQPSDLWDLSGTGLEIKPAKLPSENLVIDHIERPSPN